MLTPNQALQGALRIPPRPSASTRRVLVIGARSHLGWAVIESLLATGRFERVATLVHAPIQSTIHGFHALPDTDEALRALDADTAVVVYAPASPAHAKAQAFVHTQPDELPALAQRLRQVGVRQLIVAVPHSAVLMPAALQQGLASLDEAAVAALGFELTVFMRVASVHDAGANDGISAPQRLANWMMSQLSWLVARSEQPVRMETVAKVVAALASRLVPNTTLGSVAGLPNALINAPGQGSVRVLPSEVLWHAAQQRDAGAVIDAWWRGEVLHSERAALPWKESR
jgi:NAD(P)-dependent dehydrogenase (short-subunit alcohol dehydrogenase family)